ncbi:MAG: hypothetical protein FWE38_04110 [Firmicutes bacterium]|nr:hypothetical protein [Bacillota bacterium]
MEEIEIVNVEQSVAPQMDNGQNDRPEVADTVDSADIIVEVEKKEDEKYGDFQSVEEVYKAYENLRRAFSQKTQELAKLRESIKTPEEILKAYLEGLATSNKSVPAVIGNAPSAPSAIDGARTMSQATREAQSLFQSKDRAPSSY